MRGIDSGEDGLEIAPYYVFERKHVPPGDVVLLAKAVIVLGAKLNVSQPKCAHLQLVIEMAADALANNDEAGAYLILITEVRKLHEVQHEKSLQGLPVQEEQEVPPETTEDAGHS